MRRRPNPSKVNDDLLVFLYRNILIPWEVDFQNNKFILPKKEEGFKGFCIDNNVIVDAPISAVKLAKKQHSFVKDSRKFNGLFRISSHTRTIGEDKEYYPTPKCLLYHLRNSVAHASFGLKRCQGVDCLYFEGWFKGKLKIQAQIQESLFQEFIGSLVSTRVD